MEDAITHMHSSQRPQQGKDQKEAKLKEDKTGELGSIPGLGRSPGEGNGNPLQYSCLENPMDRGEPGGLQSMGSQRVRHDLATFTHSSILHMVMLVSMLLFPYISPSPLLSPSPLAYSLCLFLHGYPVNKFFSTISIYMCQNMIFIFLFLTYFTLYNRFQVHPPY